MRQYSISGNRCCDETDAYVFNGPWHYDYDAGGKVVSATLTLENGVETVAPRGRFVNRERDPQDINPTGSPVIWYRQIDNLFCFDPSGALG